MFSTLGSCKMIQEIGLYCTLEVHTVFRTFNLVNWLSPSFTWPYHCTLVCRQTSSSGLSHFSRVNSSLLCSRWVAKINAPQVGKQAGMLIIGCSKLLVKITKKCAQPHQIQKDQGPFIGQKANRHSLAMSMGFNLDSRSGWSCPKCPLGVVPGLCLLLSYARHCMGSQHCPGSFQRFC